VIIVNSSHDVLGVGVLPKGRQITPASSEWTQLWSPIAFAGQSMSLLSFPEQDTSSRRMGPLPSPKEAKSLAMAPTCMNHTLNYWSIKIFVSP